MFFTDGIIVCFFHGNVVIMNSFGHANRRVKLWYYDSLIFNMGQSRVYAMGGNPSGGRTYSTVAGHKRETPSLQVTYDSSYDRKSFDSLLIYS